MKKNYLILLLSLLTTSVFGQVSFEKLFSHANDDAFRCVREVPAGGYIAAGYISTVSVNDSDAFLVRFNSNGDTLWTFTYNGTLSKYDLFYKVINTSDGGFIACGYTESVTGLSDDVLYVKLNSSGQLQWVKTFGGSGIERAQDIIETSDGFTIAGYTTSPSHYYDALIIHTDLTGVILWTKSIGGTDYDDANSIEQLADGGYITGGQSAVNGGDPKQFLIRTNVNGDTLWTKRIQSVGPSNIESLTLVSDGFVFVGSINPLGLSDDGNIVKTDTSGNVLWSKIYGDTAKDDFHSVEKTSDGGFIIGGTTSSSGPNRPNMWLLKMDAQGDSSWSKTFGGDNHDHGYSAAQTSDGGYVFAGFSSSFGRSFDDAYIVKVGSNGTGTNHLPYISAYSLASTACSGSSVVVKIVIWNFGNVPVSNIPVTVEVTGAINQTLTANYSGPLAPQTPVTITFSPSINTSAGGTLTFYGFTDSPNNVYPANNLFDSTVVLVPCVGIEDVEAQLGFTLYPNPASENVLIDFSQKYSKAKIELMNCTGQIVQTFMLNNTGGMRKLIDLSSYAKGLYLFKVTTEEGFDVRRVVFE